MKYRKALLNLGRRIKDYNNDPELKRANHKGYTKPGSQNRHKN